jgi:hypothetical protein
MSILIVSVLFCAIEMIDTIGMRINITPKATKAAESMNQYNVATDKII